MAGRHGGNSNLKKGNKMEQQNQIEIKQNQLRAVVAEMPQKFDSHDVIKAFIKKYEAEYVDLLYAQRQRAPYAIFRAVHAAMGRALAEHAEALGIRKTARESSENIKGYDSENQGWEK